jgi:hypothetical protein
MMDGLGISLRRIGSGFEDCQDEKIVFVYKPCIDHLAFQIVDPHNHQGCSDALG